MSDQANINEVDLDTVEEFLVENDAPIEVREALGGLRSRWMLGREINAQRLERWRACERELASLRRGSA